MSDVTLDQESVEQLQMILNHAKKNDGVLALNCVPDGLWVCIYNFGEEEPGSEFAAGSAVQSDVDLQRVIYSVAEQVGLI